MTKKIQRYLLWGGCTLWGGLGVCYLLNMTGFAKQSDLEGFTQSALSPLAFLLVGYFLRQLHSDIEKITDIRNKKRRLMYAYGFSFGLALSFILGYQMRVMGNTLPGVWGKGAILLLSAGLGIAFLPLINPWFKLLEKEPLKSERTGQKEGNGKKIFLFSWLGIFISWIPVFLAYYPAIMSYDFHRQSQEAAMNWYNDHHPLVHTYLIHLFFELGEKIGSYEVAMAMLSLLQMLVLSVILAYSCNVIWRMTKRIWPIVTVAVIYGLLPVHPVLAMSMTKDIFFSAFFLLLLLLIWEERNFFTKEYSGSRQDVYKCVGFAAAIVLTGILAILFRNNAVYALVVFAIFYVIMSKRQRWFIGILCGSILIGGMGCKTGIRVALDAGEGSKIEMFSVFMQQMARVGATHRDRLTVEEWQMIDYYIPEEDWDGYNPTIADGIKSSAGAGNFEQWKDNLSWMIGDWFVVGTHYINEYIDAFLALTSGYWFLDDVSHAEVLGYGEDTNLGLLYTFNVSATSEFEGVESKSFLPALLSLYQKIVNGNCYYGWPVVSMLFKPALYCWLLVLIMFSHGYRRQKAKQLLSLCVLMYLFTLLLGPVVNMRYVYPIMLAVPVLLAQVFAVDSE